MVTPKSSPVSQSSWLQSRALRQPSVAAFQGLQTLEAKPARGPNHPSELDSKIHWQLRGALEQRWHFQPVSS